MESFLGRIEDRQVKDTNEPFIHNESAFRVILATNLKYSTAINQSLNIKDTISSRRRHEEIVRQITVKHNGREAAHNAQCVLCSFISVSQAVMCAIEIRNSFISLNEKHFNPMAIQLGISAGSPITENNDFFGQTIQLAKHLCYMSNSDQITLASTVVKHCSNDNLQRLEKEGAIVILNGTQENFIDQLLLIMEKSWKIEGFRLENLA
ncbi:hypothetical protein [Carboxylicivirga marina]|uniref:hypothetical protein n=1 Tax=Carboxylicivirga marina TaxID=2800988 RepID=UPI002598C476|nr:hypothetical protein [uncultured Carboxylicivirga sp.]